MLGIAITQWGEVELTKNLLRDLIASRVELTIAICDNNSTLADKDAIKLFLETEFLESTSSSKVSVTLIENSVNSGFSLGMNLSVENLLKHELDWIWVLNNDVSVGVEDLLSIVMSLSSASPGIYGTDIIEPTIDRFTGSYEYNYLTTRFLPILTEEKLSSIDQKKRYISGASMFIHRKVFEEVGLLNPRTFLYYEELDFFTRARGHNYSQCHISGPVVKHLGGGSSANDSMQEVRVYHETFSMLDHYRRHCWWMFPILLVVRSPLRIFKFILAGKLNVAKLVIRANYDFLRGRNKDLAQPSSLIETCYGG